MIVANDIRNVIVGGAIEEINLAHITSKVKQEYENIKPKGLDEDEALLAIADSLQVP